MAIIHVTDRVLYLSHQTQTDRPVLGYIRGDRASLMVDAGNSPAHAALFLQYCEALDLPSPQYVGLTHWHWDHSYGLCGIDAIAIASRQTNQQLQHMQQWEWTQQAMQNRLESGEESAFCDQHIRCEYPDPQQIRIRSADIVFDDSLTLDLGGITCQMLRVGGPHSPDSVVFYIPEHQVLFLGDADCDACYQPDPASHPQKLRQLANCLTQLDFNICIPGHDTQLTRRKLINYWESELGESLIGECFDQITLDI